jgi:Fe-S-cluster containining protein
VSLGCAGCGDCCDNDLNAPLALVQRVVANPDDFNASAVADAQFITEHWLPDGEVTYGPDGGGWVHMVCDRFDPLHRRCGDYENRPRICSGFPMYPEDEADNVTPLDILKMRAQRMSGRCSYQLDIPPDLRRPGARPLIPVTVLRG